MGKTEESQQSPTMGLLSHIHHMLKTKSAQPPTTDLSITDDEEDNISTGSAKIITESP